MLSIYYGREEYPVKCQLKRPIYNENGDAISWENTDKFCYCKESGFETDQTKERNVRYIHTKGVLTTNTLKKDEINVDWKIIFENEEYMIDRINVKDDEKQQTMLKAPLVITTLYVRR